MVTEFSKLTETALERTDRALDRLHRYKEAWLKLSLETRIRYLERCLHNALRIAPEWANTACAIKGLDPNSELAGEEWLAGPFAILHYLRLLIRTLKDQSGNNLQCVERSPNLSVTQVFPNDLFDRLLWLGVTAEIWSQPEESVKLAPPGQGAIALVLGAGNISSIAPLDVLHQLFVENRVVLLKMNPVVATLAPWLTEVFKDLQADGFVEIVCGGAELGSYLCQHPVINAVHITGSQRTHDAIAWGNTPEEQQERKTSRTPLLQRPITSELGGITPIIVVPGNWSKQDLVFQARHVASMVTHNASFNCVAGKVLVLAKGWKQRDLFLDLVRQQLRQIPPRKAYYPGAQARYETFLSQYPTAEILGQSAPGCIPWTLLPNVPPCAGEYALTEEAFCAILAEVSLEAETPEEFLETAVAFVNNSIYGTLSCTVLIDPKTQRQNRLEVEDAIAHLRYGSIGINIWSGVLFAMPEIPWGAFPGNPLEDIGSGSGFVHNALLVENPQKAVVYAPFRIWPTPLWFAQHRTLKQVSQRLLQFEANPSWRRLLPVIVAALGG
jgi:acyl-CoA reductase-like NAD-dependent aldehyde dehydrogenase